MTRTLRLTFMVTLLVACSTLPAFSQAADTAPKIDTGDTS